MAAEAPAEPVPEGEATEVGWRRKKRDLKTVSMTGSGGGSASTCVYGSHRVSPKN